MSYQHVQHHLEYNNEESEVDINIGLQSNDNHIEDINENDNLEEEYGINKEIQENENCEEVRNRSKNYIARIKGGFGKCLSVIFNEQKSKYKYDLEGKNIGIINSFDGDNHLHNEEGSNQLSHAVVNYFRESHWIMVYLLDLKIYLHGCRLWGKKILLQ